MVHSRIAHLSVEEKQRYFDKIDILGNDPYLLSSKELTSIQLTSKLPDLSFHDIYIYLIHNNPSPYSGEQLKAHKSTEAYRYFKDGWVKEVKVHRVDMKKIFIFVGRVSDIMMKIRSL